MDINTKKKIHKKNHSSTSTLNKNNKNSNKKNQKKKIEKKLETECKNIKKTLEKEREKFIRLFAEFENYKKRIEKEKIELFSIVSEQIIFDLIPVLDDFDRGIKELKKYNNKQEILIKGIILIQEKLINILKNKGLNKIDTKKGDKFNTDFHEAITQIPAIKEELKGKIIEIIEDGYLLKEKVIRHAKVITGK